MKKLIKTWGWERWFANNPLYCGKMIHVNYGKWSSRGRYHYHKIKDETFFVVKGILKLEYYDGDTHDVSVMMEGESFHVGPGMKHRFTAGSPHGCKFIEVSTQHFEEDSYRTELIGGEWT